MSSRRSFLKSGLVAGAIAGLPAMSAGAKLTMAAEKPKRKNWVWIRPDDKDTESKLNELFRSFREAGIYGVFIEHDSEKHFQAAKAHGLETHRWMWTMNRREQTLLNAHPEWYAVSRKGDSCATHPPYVNYYRWLCPSREEVRKYLEDDVNSILSKPYVDGIHLDYVRVCDVILPVNLWQNYKIEQTRELPEYDFCYCEVCRTRFNEWRSKDIRAVEYPEADLSWRLYRYHAITGVVNRLAKVARSHKKPITAAVFPTPEVARRNVRQDWVNWDLDGICPMIYHGFYREPVAWIGDAVQEGVHALHGKFPLYAGIYIPDFKTDDEITEGVKYALANGAHGVSLFGDVTPAVLAAMEKGLASG